MKKEVIEIAKTLQLLHPEYRKELNELIYAYEQPFSCFQEREVKFRLVDELNIDDTVDCYQNMKDDLFNDFNTSDSILDNDFISYLSSHVVHKYAKRLKEKVDLEHIKNCKNPLINLDESNPEMLSHLLSKPELLEKIKEIKFNYEYISLEQLKELTEEENS